MRREFRWMMRVLGVLLAVGLLLPGSVLAAGEGLSLSVSYEARCGAPSTFQVQAAGGSGAYRYYLGNVTREGEDGRYFVVDPSRLPGYQESGTFSFTFTASGVYELHFYVLDKGTLPMATQRTTLRVVLDDPAYPTVEAVADQVAAQCRASCQSDYDRALWLHDWLVDHCEYDHTLLYCGAEGALTRGIGTCESYHRAYEMLLRRVGLETGRMEGNGHVWTAVRMDGDWYQVDVTWDDNGYSSHTFENYLYFGLNDALMALVHPDHAPNRGYESDSLENHYLIRSGAIRRWSDPLSEAAQRHLNAGETSFSLPVTERLPGSQQDVVYGLAAWQLSAQTWTAGGRSVQLRAAYSQGQMQVEAAYGAVDTPAARFLQAHAPLLALPLRPEPLPLRLTRWSTELTQTLLGSGFSYELF